MKWFRDACAGDDAQRAEVRAAPLKAPLELLRGLPTTLVITDEADVPRDERVSGEHLGPFAGTVTRRPVTRTARRGSGAGPVAACAVRR